ncbi:MAG: hypothetical protein LH624_18765 [Cryobacterium sp.]|nr:hypothetical protein [Cryobacterium sp.]
MVNTSGAKLNIDATAGLGLDSGFTVSVCTPSYAVDASAGLAEVITALKTGTPQTFVVGVGHGTCICEGGAFEYALTVEQELQNAGVRDLAEVIYLTTEHELGDFGVAGMTFSTGGQRVTSEGWMESLFRQRSMKAITQAAVTKIEPGLIHYTKIDGTEGTQPFEEWTAAGENREHHTQHPAPHRHRPTARAERTGPAQQPAGTVLSLPEPELDHVPARHEAPLGNACTECDPRLASLTEVLDREVGCGQDGEYGRTARKEAEAQRVRG